LRFTSLTLACLICVAPIGAALAQSASEAVAKVTQDDPDT
jgi:hypothetical protein